MHRRALRVRRVGQVQVQRLTLVDERATVSRHLENRLLRDLPHSPVEVLDVLRNARNVLNRAVGGDETVLEVVVPDALSDEVFQEMRVDDLKETVIKESLTIRFVLKRS